MAEVRITTESRTEFGKGAARRVRREGKVPAVLYGHGSAPRHLTLPGHELMMALKTANVLLALDIDGASELALPKDVQRDPLRGTLKHLDLVVVRRGEKVVVDVPVTVVGDLAPDGVLNQEHNTVQVETEATHIPSGIEVDISTVPVGGHVSAGDLVLPEGSTLVTDPEALVLGVAAAATAEQLEAELAEAEAEAGIVHEEKADEAEQSSPGSGDGASEGEQAGA